MKFRIGLVAFIILVALIGVVGFLFLPKGSAKNGIFFNTYEGVYAKITGSVSGNANSITLSDLTYGEGATPTADELASWQVNLEFGEEDEITITINVENKNTNSLYVIFKDDKQTINNVTKTILNDGRPYTSGKVVLLQSDTNTTLFTITFRRDQDVITSIRYNYHIELKAEVTDADIQDGSIEAEENSGYTYEFNNEDNTAKITGLSATNTENNLVLPSMVLHGNEVYTVTTIGSNTFRNKTTITSVIIPNTVTELKACVFEGCTNLTNVTIPTSVTNLGSKVFKGCSNLASIELPNSITSIGTHLFSGCTKLTTYNIPTSTTKLSDRMFEKCESITEFTFPTQITTLGDYVFNGLSFETLTIPDTITTLTENSFSGIINISELIIPCFVTSLQCANDGLFNGVANISKATIIATNKGTVIGKVFYCTSVLQEVEISDGVTSIVNQAFNGCVNLMRVKIANLESWLNISFESADSNPLWEANHLYVGNNEVTELVIPEGTTEIKDYAFYCGRGLISVTIPNSVIRIGDYAFCYCGNLTNVAFGNNLTSIGNNAFQSCLSLTSVTIGSGVTSIGSSAFYECSSLTSVTIGSGVTSIGNSAFNTGSRSLTNVTIESLESWLNISFGSADSNPLWEANHLYVGNNEVTELVIPEGTTEIKGYAFYNCDCITSVVIPDSVTRIGSSAFYGCYALAEIYNKSAITITERTIDNSYVAYYAEVVYSGDTINTPTRIEEIDGVKYYKESDTSYIALKCIDKTKTTIDLDSRTTRIKDFAFYKCNNLTSITIPNGVTSIGDWAFYYCISLTNITIPNGVTSIGDTAFDGCSSLTSVTIGSGVSSIGDWAFEYCSSLTSITIPNSVTSIGFNAFYGCYALAEIYNKSALSITKGSGIAQYAEVVYSGDTIDAPSKIEEIDGVAYYKESETSYIAIGLIDKTKTTISLDSRTAKIRQRAFYNCSSLTSVTIPNSVTSMGNEVFRDCSSLTSVIIPDSVTSIGERAFYNCNGLTGVNIGNGVTHINERTFYNCNSLTSVTIGSSVASIGNYAFYNCSSLTSVTIPDGVTSIGDYAFLGCGGLTSVNIGNGVTSIGHSAFNSCNNLIMVTIGSCVVNIRTWAFLGCCALAEIYNKSSLTIAKGSADNGYLAYYAEVVYSGDTINTPSKIEIIDGVAYYKESGTSYIALKCIDKTKTTISLDSRTTKISQYAFENCGSLTNITIPNSVSSIGIYAFNNCSSLNSVTFENPNNWFVADSSTATSGINIKLTNASTNAAFLRLSYYSKYWKRNG